MSAPLVSGAVAILLESAPGLTPDQVKYRLKATANTNWPGYSATTAGAGYLDVYAAVKSTTTQSANTGINASQLLWTGSNPVSWGSVNWNSVNWNSVNWNSVNWNSVNWNSVNWNSDHWDGGVTGAGVEEILPEINTTTSGGPDEEQVSSQNQVFMPLITR